MNERKGPIVITGASGRVGNLLAQILLSKGHRIRAVARDASKLHALKSDNTALELIESSFTDTATLTRAFADAAAVFVLTPINLLAANVNEEQRRNVVSMTKAIRDAGVKNVVLLSSWGVELPEKSGGIAGCRFFENELDQIPDLNTLILRPVWFMENFIYNIDLIKISGINGLAISRDVPFPMVATRDIAEVAAAYLADGSFFGKNILYIKGAREYNMREVTDVLGNAVGRPGIRYIEFPQSILKKGLVDSGQLSPDAADMLVEINQCISQGLLKADADIPIQVTSTSLEEFASTQFALAFHEFPEPPLQKKLKGLLLRFFLHVAGNRLWRKERVSALPTN